MPITKFTIEGTIADFTRIDNLYTAMKTEGGKFLKEWTISFHVDYTEKEGELKTSF